MSQWKQFTRLIRLYLRVHLGLSVMRENRARDRKAFWKYLGLGLVIALAVLSVLFTYGMILYYILKPALEAGLGEILLGLVFLICMLMVLILGTITMISAVFGARDTEFYAALPLNPRAVFLSKLGVVYLLELFTSLFLALPAVILYAAYTPVTAWYWLGCLAVIPLLPVIPMALAALLSMLLLRVSVGFRHRELFLVLGGLVLIILLVFGQAQLNVFLTSSALNDGQLVSMLSDSEGTLRLLTGAFPPALWAAGTLALDGLQALSSFGWYLLAVIAGILLLIAVGGRAFYRGALAQLETARAKSRGFSAKAVRGRTVTLSLFVREWRVLLRTGVYALNALAGMVIFPVLIVVMSQAMPKSGGMQLNLKEIISTVSGPMLTLVSAAIMALPALISPAASTALSREGRQFWTCRSIPVTMRTQMFAKLLCALSISLIGELLMFGSLFFFLPIPAENLLYGLPIALCASWPLTAISMVPDVIKPKLLWHSENESIKQNTNSLLGMLLALLTALLGGVIAWQTADLLPTPVLVLLLMVLFLLLGYVFHRVLRVLCNRFLETREA